MTRRGRRAGRLACALSVACLALPASLQADEPLRLRYFAPAREWTEALPVGNGRLGAMVFGGVESERLQLNEATLWSGRPTDWNNPESRAALPAVRAAVLAGDWAQATALARKMQGPYTQSYQPLGDLRLSFGPDAVRGAGSYERSLDLERAVATVTYRAGDATFTREVWSSAPDQVTAVRLTCDRPGRIAFAASLASLLRHAVETDGKDTLVLRGRAPSHVDPSYLRSANPIRYDDAPERAGMTFELRVAVVAEGGSVVAGGSTLTVRGADAVTLLVSAATGFEARAGRPGATDDVSARAQRTLDAARGVAYAELARRHVEDHRRLFGRVALDLGSAPDAAGRATDVRVSNFMEGAPDPGLASLLFQYGRYLLIASSRPGGLPANLQGLWNESMRPPWSSNWTLNINAEMNYWPAEVAGLPETHEPLLAFIERLAANGRVTAEVNYGARGWVAHHNTDIWGQTAPVGNFGGGDPKWANWPMGGAWLSTHLWEHYAFGGDRVFLRDRAWPVMKSAAEFCLDWLIEDGQGHLVTAPSTSPELGFRLPDGQEASVTLASTMDISIIWELFSDVIDAARILGIEAEFAGRLQAARARLYPLKVGARGQLQEWAHDLMETEVHHRHPSHLFGVHPGRRIGAGDAALRAAARRALEIRGDDGTGWSLGWKLNLWARLRDGDRAYRMVQNLLRLVREGETRYGPGGGVYPNLFDAHPPFQIDGNFAFTAGIAEMLVQSELVVDRSGSSRATVELLPALPSAWPAGRVSGLRGRGGFEVAALSWSDRRVVTVEIVSRLGGPVEIRVGPRVLRVNTRPGEHIALDGSLRRRAP